MQQLSIKNLLIRIQFKWQVRNVEILKEHSTISNQIIYHFMKAEIFIF